jgi:hypothetical protein
MEKEVYKLYEVCVKCGHVGKGKYIDKVIAMIAHDAKSAALLARNMPRVKHDHKDAIRYVKEIDQERYNEIIERNSHDMYFQCENVQQSRECLVFEQEEIKEEEYFFEEEKEESNKTFFVGKTKIKDPKKYFKREGFDSLEKF